jgi:hypothetical protein
MLGYLLINSVALIAIYFLLTVHYKLIFIPFVYLGAGAVLGLAYVIYNRGFVGRNATPDMLPDDMPLEKKKAFLEDCRVRLHKSRWMLTVILPIAFAIGADLMYLFLWPMLQGAFR